VYIINGDRGAVLLAKHGNTERERERTPETGDILLLPVQTLTASFENYLFYNRVKSKKIARSNRSNCSGTDLSSDRFSQYYTWAYRVLETPVPLKSLRFV